MQGYDTTAAARQIDLNRDPIEAAYAERRFVYFDCESIPNQDPDYLAHVLKTIKPPARLKKAESIEKWMDTERNQAAWDIVAKTSFDGGLGHVCTISWALNGGDIYTRHARTLEDERLVLHDFFDDLDPYHSMTLVGHNVLGFDIKFLTKRALLLKIKLPKPHIWPRDPKAWDKSVFDTMTAWAGQRDFIKQNELCRILGIEGKGDFDGSMVAEAWARGEHEKIAEYCPDDVRQVREIHKRFLISEY
jgi:3'-5' exonuclease